VTYIPRWIFAVAFLHISSFLTVLGEEVTRETGVVCEQRIAPAFIGLGGARELARLAEEADCRPETDAWSDDKDPAFAFLQRRAHTTTFLISRPT
jgi:hypothetical protein